MQIASLYLSQTSTPMSLETLNNQCQTNWPILSGFVYNAVTDARECCSFSMMLGFFVHCNLFLGLKCFGITDTPKNNIVDFGER